jgi:Ca-activated chloride channel family protein
MEWHLMRPEWLWGLLPTALLAALLWRARSQRGSWAAVIAPELLEHLVSKDTATRAFNYLPLLFAGWIIAILAAAGPSWEKLPQPVQQKQDALVILLDLSFSMKAADLPPSRIDRARQKVIDILASRREGQTALVAYAGDAHIVTPLTDDTPTISNLLPALHPDMMPLPGSDPVAAVELALELLRSAGIRRGQLLLITDSITESDTQAIPDLVRKANVQLAVLGVGTTTGAPIPLERGGFVKDESGAIVMPGLRMDTLQQLAQDSAGRFATLTIDDRDVNYLLAADNSVEPEQLLALDRGADTWDDKGYWLALLLLPLALGLFRRGWLLCALPLMLILPAESARADGWDDLWLTRDQQAQRALQQGDNERAASLFERNDWAGKAAYNAEDFTQAAERFAQGDSADDWYNRGNALARAGNLEEAAQAYRQSLQREPGAEDAQANLELIEQLQQQQQSRQEGGGQPGNQQKEQDEGSQAGQSPDGSEGEQGDSNAQQNSNDGAASADDPQQSNDQQSPGQAQDAAESPAQDTPQASSQPDSAQDEPEASANNTAGAAADAEASPAQQGEAAGAQAQSLEQSELDQATEQWLRRVPDDPSGLLRQKFRFESERRKRQGNRRSNETYW